MENGASNRPLVLVADDEPGIRLLARRILEGAGYDVVEAADGDEALRIIEAESQIAFLMADLDMPVLRGEAMAVRAREMRPELPVLYVTAHSSVLFRESKLLPDREAFLDKPFTARGLLEAVSLLRTGRLKPVEATATKGPAAWIKALMARFNIGPPPSSDDEMRRKPVD